MIEMTSAYQIKMDMHMTKLLHLFLFKKLKL